MKNILKTGDHKELDFDMLHNGKDLGEVGAILIGFWYVFFYSG